LGPGVGKTTTPAKRFAPWGERKLVWGGGCLVVTQKKNNRRKGLGGGGGVFCSPKGGLNTQKQKEKKGKPLDHPKPEARHEKGGPKKGGGETPPPPFTTPRTKRRV